MELRVVLNPSLDKLATATKETCCESVKAGQMNRTVLVTSLYFIYVSCTQLAAAIAKNLHFLPLCCLAHETVSAAIKIPMCTEFCTGIILLDCKMR